MKRDIIDVGKNKLSTEVMGELTKTFHRSVNEIRYLLSQFITYNTDRPLQDRVKFVLNIDRECVISVGGYLAAVRTNTHAEDLDGEKDDKYYHNNIDIYTSINGKYYQAFLDPALLDSVVFIYKKELHDQTLEMKCIIIDEDDAARMDNYFKIAAIEEQADEEDDDLPVPNNGGKAIIETSEGG